MQEHGEAPAPRLWPANSGRPQIHRSTDETATADLPL